MRPMHKNQPRRYGGTIYNGPKRDWAAWRARRDRAIERGGRPISKTTGSQYMQPNSRDRKPD